MAYVVQNPHDMISVVCLKKRFLFSVSCYSQITEDFDNTNSCDVLANSSIKQDLIIEFQHFQETESFNTTQEKRDKRAHFLQLVRDLETIEPYSFGNEATRLWMRTYEVIFILF